MKSISDGIYVVKRLNYGIVKGKKVKVLEGVVTQHIDIEPFKRGNGDTEQCRMVAHRSLSLLISGRGLLQRWRGGLNPLRLPWRSGR